MNRNYSFVAVAEVMVPVGLPSSDNVSWLTRQDQASTPDYTQKFFFGGGGREEPGPPWINSGKGQLYYSWGSSVPILRNVAWDEAYLCTKWHLDPSNRLATIYQRHRETDRTD